MGSGVCCHAGIPASHRLYYQIEGMEHLKSQSRHLYTYLGSFCLHPDRKCLRHDTHRACFGSKKGTLEGTCIRKVLEVILEKFPTLPGPPLPPNFTHLKITLGLLRPPIPQIIVFFQSSFTPTPAMLSPGGARAPRTPL